MQTGPGGGHCSAGGAARGKSVEGRLWHVSGGWALWEGHRRCCGPLSRVGHGGSHVEPAMNWARVFALQSRASCGG